MRAKKVQEERELELGGSREHRCRERDGLKERRLFQKLDNKNEPLCG
jgi:hypothetical protein